MKTRRVKNKRKSRRGGSYSRKRGRDEIEEMNDYSVMAKHDCIVQASNIARSNGRVGINDAYRLTQQLASTCLPDTDHRYPAMCELLFNNMRSGNIPCKFYFDLAEVLYSKNSVRLMGTPNAPTMNKYNDNVLQFLSKSIDEGVLPATLRDAIEISKQLQEMAQMSNENRR